VTEITAGGDKRFEPIDIKSLYIKSRHITHVTLALTHEFSDA